MSWNVPGGPSFGGFSQPPDVPCDPSGTGWRGATGATGPKGDKGDKGDTGAVGPMPPGGPFLPLSGGTVSGPTTFTDMLSMTGSQTWVSGAFPGTNPAIYQSLTYTGAPTAGLPGPEGTSVPVNLIALSENMVATAPAIVNAFEIQHHTTGGDGGRHGLLVTHQVTGSMGTTNATYVGAQIFQSFGGNVSGAASGAGNGKGDAFGFSVHSQVGAGSFAHGVTGIEIDVDPFSGSSVDYLVGEQIINFGVAGMTANVFDAMHLLATSNPATNKRSNLGYYFGNPQAADTYGFPITATGTMIGSRTGACAFGIDFSAVTFSGALLKGPNNFLIENNNRVHSDSTVVPSGTFIFLDNALAPIAAFIDAPSSKNYLNFFSGATGNSPMIAASGLDTNTGLNFKTQNTGPFNFYDGNNFPVFTITPIASPANWIAINGAIGGQPPVLWANGTDANVNLELAGKGTGGVYTLGRTGFQGTTPIAKPTVSGAKGSNAALASLMTALAAYGLVTDSTTA